MDKGWQSLPQLRNDKLLFEDTAALPRAGAITACLLCCKPFIMRMYTGIPDQICSECWDVYKDAARVICVKCQVTICRLVPKVLDNGYYIRPRSILHSSACNVCNPGLTMSTIVEIDEWMKRIRPGKIIVPFGESNNPSGKLYT